SQEHPTTTVPSMQKPLLSLVQQISAGATLPHVINTPLPRAASEGNLPAPRVSPKTAAHHWAQNELPLLPKTLRIAPRPTTPPIDAVRMVLRAWRREVDFASSLVSSSNFEGFICISLPLNARLGNTLAARQAFFLNNFGHQRS